MPRVTIEQFRASLTARPDRDALARVYRELSRHPQLASAAGFTAWGDWSGPPGGVST